MNYDFNSLKRGGGKAFLDTGTTFVYFGKELFEQFTSFFKGFCKSHPKNCAGSEEYEECYHFNPKHYKNLDEFLATFPPINFTFNGNINFNWNPYDYLVQALGSKQHYCPGVKMLKDVILGAVFMRNFDVYFDKVQKQISFTRSNCGKVQETIPTADDDTQPGKTAVSFKKMSENMDATFSEKVTESAFVKLKQKVEDNQPKEVEETTETPNLFQSATDPVRSHTGRKHKKMIRKPPVDTDKPVEVEEEKIIPLKSDYEALEAEHSARSQKHTNKERVKKGSKITHINLLTLLLVVMLIISIAAIMRFIWLYKKASL